MGNYYNGGLLPGQPQIRPGQQPYTLARNTTVVEPTVYDRQGNCQLCYDCAKLRFPQLDNYIAASSKNGYPHGHRAIHLPLCHRQRC